ncbi:MAG: hypothetical protein ACK4N5_03910 [Myxococcales bacterium]
MRFTLILLTAATLLSCGAAYEITRVQMELAPPEVLFPAISPSGAPVSVGDLRGARGHLDLDVVQRRLVFEASGLPQIPGNRLQEGFRYRLWLRDVALTPIYVDELPVDQAGRVTLRRIFASDARIDLASIREGIVVLWFDDSPVPIDPAFSSSAELSGEGVGQRKDFHSGAPQSHSGWVLEGFAEDLPASATGEGGHQH